MRARTGKRIAALSIGAVLLVAPVACGSSDRGSDEAAPTASITGAAAGTAGEELSGDLTVSAATSLTDAFDEIIAEFEEANPGVDVEATYDSSGTLSEQIISGAPVDVFASADVSNIEEVAAEDLIDKAEAFARNELVIVTKPGNPQGIESLADLAAVDGTISLCNVEAPCGRYAAEALQNAEITLDEGSVTRGQNAGATLTAVIEGDAVAGIVYVTDAQGAGDAADSVPIPDDENVTATYAIASLADADEELAQAFIGFVLSDKGQQVLAHDGFLPPP